MVFVLVYSKLRDYSENLKCDVIVNSIFMLNGNIEKRYLSEEESIFLTQSKFIKKDHAGHITYNIMLLFWKARLQE